MEVARRLAGSIGANHHGIEVLGCFRGKERDCRTLCWGVLRWHGCASDGDVLCEGHFAEAEGAGYKRPPTARQRRHARKGEG